MQIRRCQARFFPIRLVASVPVLVLTLGVAGCGGEAPPAEPAASAPAEAPAPPAVTAPRVYFIQPQEGASVKSPVHFEFGIEGFEVAAVPQGQITMVRSGMGHHHLGVDTDCLPVGEVIPMANPWVHFGGAQTTIDMQLTPGPHKFALQIGDDEHRTLPGLCSTISITVVE